MAGGEVQVLWCHVGIFVVSMKIVSRYKLLLKDIMLCEKIYISKSRWCTLLLCLVFVRSVKVLPSVLGFQEMSVTCRVSSSLRGISEFGFFWFVSARSMMRTGCCSAASRVKIFCWHCISESNWSGLACHNRQLLHCLPWHTLAVVSLLYRESTSNPSCPMSTYL